MMGASSGEMTNPTRLRTVLAAIVVLLTVLAAWKVIDYRSQPPPPPNPVGVPVRR